MIVFSIAINSQGQIIVRESIKQTMSPHLPQLQIVSPSLLSSLLLCTSFRIGGGVPCWTRGQQDQAMRNSGRPPSQRHILDLSVTLHSNSILNRSFPLLYCVPVSNMDLEALAGPLHLALSTLTLELQCCSVLRHNGDVAHLPTLF